MNLYPHQTKARKETGGPKDLLAGQPSQSVSSRCTENTCFSKWDGAWSRTCLSQPLASAQTCRETHNIYSATHRHTYTYAYTPHTTYTVLHTDTHIHMHTPCPHQQGYTQHTQCYTQTHIYICTHTHIYTHACTHSYVLLYTHTHIHIHNSCAFLGVPWYLSTSIDRSMFAKSSH